MTTDAQALADALALVEQLRRENQALHAVIAELEQRVVDPTAENKALIEAIPPIRPRVMRPVTYRGQRPTAARSKAPTQKQSTGSNRAASPEKVI